MHLPRDVQAAEVVGHHVGRGGGGVHLPRRVQAAEVVCHQGGRLHLLQGVGALVLAASLRGWGAGLGGFWFLNFSC